VGVRVRAFLAAVARARSAHARALDSPVRLPRFRGLSGRGPCAQSVARDARSEKRRCCSSESDGGAQHPARPSSPEKLVTRAATSGRFAGSACSLNELLRDRLRPARTAMRRRPSGIDRRSAMLDAPAAASSPSPCSHTTPSRTQGPACPQPTAQHPHQSQARARGRRSSPRRATSRALSSCSTRSSSTAPSTRSSSSPPRSSPRTRATSSGDEASPCATSTTSSRPRSSARSSTSTIAASPTPGPSCASSRWPNTRCVPCPTRSRTTRRTLGAKLTRSCAPSPAAPRPPRQRHAVRAQHG